MSAKWAEEEATTRRGSVECDERAEELAVERRCWKSAKDRNRPRANCRRRETESSANFAPVPLVRSATSTGEPRHLTIVVARRRNQCGGSGASLYR